jgi:hypothetical protein
MPILVSRAAAGHLHQLLALHQALCRWRTLLMASRLLLTSCELLSPSLVEEGSGELLHNKRSQVSSL